MLNDQQQFQAVNLLSDPGYIGGKKVVPQCAEVRVNWNLTSGTRGHMILHGRYVGTFDVSPAEVNAALGALVGHASWAALDDFIAPTASISGLDVRDLNTADKPYISAAGNQVGASTGTPLPDEVAFCITFRTARAGQSGRGRTYIPGFASNALGANGLVAAGAVTAAQNWAAGAFPSMMQALGFTHCLALPARQSYTGSTGTVHPAREAGTEDITGYVARDNHWDSQRRRGLK